ncbi:hypothetical protein E2C01_029989 [Portunus trituberculatus]|uniref:Uncharacterized protein n=1 Tax=Portunus trituberculatus TaxID=210409 RepID=A0A5B7ETI6_PORTR|nr:hypothetical protein [Portunus trituberculatus]
MNHCQSINQSLHSAPSPSQNDTLSFRAQYRFPFLSMICQPLHHSQHFHTPPSQHGAACLPSPPLPSTGLKDNHPSSVTY